MNVAFQRLRTQRLVGPPFPSAVEAVRALVAVQSQDYPAAKWALGLRLRGATDRALDALCDAGTLLRTHVLRPTWHFVLPEDIHWLLELTAPRIKQALGSYDRKLDLDSRVHARAFGVFEKELRDRRYRTRTELADALERSRIPARGQRLGHLMMNAELDGVVVSGPLRGKQRTYALLDERAPHRRRLGRDEALAELALRYFTGHGPAQLEDFSWWSGLSPADARRGLESVRSELASAELEGRTYWASP
ncbi:MAG TPA: winged helix DNA-binding domain-containing protein, partial [Myxococcaceae bacterium]|nr:winged helix DNA-binding domain-containing protein [Myxococcaceae bacterium]